jgi:hypothetical protein
LHRHPVSFNTGTVEKCQVELQLVPIAVTRQVTLSGDMPGEQTIPGIIFHGIQMNAVRESFPDTPDQSDAASFSFLEG